MTKDIPFFDLKKQNQKLKPAFDKVWKEVVSGSEFILGKRVEAFEKEFAQYIGTPYALGVSTGLDALTLSLKALGIGPGDEVLVPANTFIATALAVSSTGARPVLCDVDEATLLCTAAHLDKAITKKTRAIVPVHLYGQPLEMKEILAWAQKKNLLVVEDACQAHGASYGGKKPGSFGDAGCFSFFPSKNLGAFGDGGIITVKDAKIYEKLKLLRNYGSVVKYHHEIEGNNMRLDSLQAGILSVKLKHLDGWNRNRNRLAARYNEKLSNIKALQILPVRKSYTNVYHLYIIRTTQRDELKKYLENLHIHTGIHYPIPIHLQRAYRYLGYQRGDFPVAETSSEQVLSLPMYPEMALSDVDRVCRAIQKYFE